MIATAIDAGYSTDCANIKISDNAAYGLIATAIYTDNSMYCTEYSAGGSIADIDDVDLADFADINISDDAADELIAADAGDSTDYADTSDLDDTVGGLMTLMVWLLLRN